jgi:hypothetical protein
MARKSSTIPPLTKADQANIARYINTEVAPLFHTGKQIVLFGTAVPADRNFHAVKFCRTTRGAGRVPKP